MKISSNITLGDNAITQTYAVLGKRGSGKSHTACVMVEEFVEAGHQVIVIDPTDGWWGLKSSRSGKKAGYPFIVFGGWNDDLPLQAEAGALLADFALDSRRSMILSLRRLSKAKQRRLVAEFLSQLYLAKGQRGDSAPLHIVIDEAHLFVPQQFSRHEGNAAIAIGAVNDIVLQGRVDGFGATLITQRPAKLNNDVLTQCEVLIAHQMTGAPDKKAVKSWVEDNADAEDMKTFLETLTTFQKGEAWFWSPSWMRAMRTIKVRQKRTFDSSATPTGDTSAGPAKIAKVDLGELKTKMAALVEEAKSNDPKELKRQINKLQTEIKQRQKKSESVKPKIDEQAIADAVSDAGKKASAAILQNFKAWSKAIQPVAKRLEHDLAKVNEMFSDERMNQIWKPITELISDSHATIERTLVEPRKKVARKASTTKPMPDTLDDWFRPAHQKLLNSIAWLNTVGIEIPAKPIVAAIALVSPKSGSFNNNVSRLSTGNLVEYPIPGHVTLTQFGKSVAEYPDIEPSIDGLHEAWRKSPCLRPAHVKLLDIVIDTWPNEINKVVLAEQADVSPTSGSFNNNVSRLSSLGLIQYPQPGWVEATNLLFP